MARQDKATNDSYTPDAFDNPPIGPVGVHRGPRSTWARLAPYLAVLVVAVLASALVWGVMTGELTKTVQSWGWFSSSQSADGTDDSSSADKPAADDAAGSDDGADSGATNGTDSSSDANGATDANGTDSSSDGADGADSSDTPDAQTQQTPEPNKGTAVRVINATGIAGYAAQQAGVLTAAGYTSVEAANPSGGALPDVTVVWYQNETDLATAQDVAASLGIATVQQVTGIDVPVVVVLMG